MLLLLSKPLVLSKKWISQLLDNLVQQNPRQGVLLLPPQLPPLDPLLVHDGLHMYVECHIAPQPCGETPGTLQLI